MEKRAYRDDYGHQDRKDRPNRSPKPHQSNRNHRNHKSRSRSPRPNQYSKSKNISHHNHQNVQKSSDRPRFKASAPEVGNKGIFGPENTAISKPMSDTGSENDSQSDLEDDYEFEQITEGLQNAKLGEQGITEVDDMEFEVLDDAKKAQKAKKSWVLSQRSKEFLEEWKKVTKFGKTIEGTKILPIKTPMMRRKWIENTQKEDQFDLIELVKTLKAEDKKVGAIIDINGSDNRYYNWEHIYKENQELLKNVEYKKIKFSYDEMSNKTTLNKVYDVLNKHQFKDHLVLIHCTRGINRTGHALCYFMCKRLELKPDEAIRRFEEARGYPIQSKKILEDLHDRFD